MQPSHPCWAEVGASLKKPRLLDVRFAPTTQNCSYAPTDVELSHCSDKRPWGWVDRPHEGLFVPKGRTITMCGSALSCTSHPRLNSNPEHPTSKTCLRNGRPDLLQTGAPIDRSVADGKLLAQRKEKPRTPLAANDTYLLDRLRDMRYDSFDPKPLNAHMLLEE